MKSIILIAIVVLATSATTFAGPEEHNQAQKCYGLYPPPPGLLPAYFPFEVCVETIEINPVNNTISVFSYFQPELFADMQISSIVRQTKDTYSFIATKVLYHNWDVVCGEGKTVRLNISGQTDFLGYGRHDELTVIVKQESLNESCSEPQYLEFQYK